MSDQAVRTLVAVAHDMTSSPADFRAWSLGVFISLLAYDAADPYGGLPFWMQLQLTPGVAAYTALLVVAVLLIPAALVVSAAREGRVGERSLDGYGHLEDLLGRALGTPAQLAQQIGRAQWVCHGLSLRAG